MRYYYDTEFLEGTQTKSILGIPFGKTKPTIDLISIGIVSEDNRELYLISKDFNLKEAWNRYDLKHDIDNGGIKKVYWIRENVLFSIWVELWCKDTNQNCEFVKKNMTSTANAYPSFTYKSLKHLINKYGKTNKQIAEDIKEFVFDKVYIQKIDDKFVGGSDAIKGNIEFYGYFADYDWVVFCWLFGKMIDLPTGFPMYTRDLKQMLDEYDEGATLSNIENHPNYPKQTNEHSSIHDAHWNKALYEFLNNL